MPPDMYIHEQLIRERAEERQKQIEQRFLLSQMPTTRTEVQRTIALSVVLFGGYIARILTRWKIGKSA